MARNEREVSPGATYTPIQGSILITRYHNIDIFLRSDGNPSPCFTMLVCVNLHLIGSHSSHQSVHCIPPMSQRRVTIEAKSCKAIGPKPEMALSVVQSTLTSNPTILFINRGGYSAFYLPRDQQHNSHLLFFTIITHSHCNLVF